MSDLNRSAKNLMEPQLSAAEAGIRRKREAFDIVRGGMSASAAIFVGMVTWGLLFDHAGGESFSSTVFGLLYVWPAVLVILLSGAVTWSSTTAPRKRAAIFAGQVIATMAAIGYAWLGS